MEYQTPKPRSHLNLYPSPIDLPIIQLYHPKRRCRLCWPLRKGHHDEDNSPLTTRRRHNPNNATLRTVQSINIDLRPFTNLNKALMHRTRSRESAKLTNIGQLLERHGKELLGRQYRDPMSSFSDFQEFSVLNPEVYWQIILKEMGILFSIPPECISNENSSYPGGQWLLGCSLNPATNCLTLNSKRQLDNIAVVWRDEGEDDIPVKKMTLQELCREELIIDILGMTERTLKKAGFVEHGTSYHSTMRIKK